jgi:HD superfamily phosphodiesterase
MYHELVMKMSSVKYPLRADADSLLQWAAELNPGQWVLHSQLVGEAARVIANSVQGMDADLSEVAGILHDIGRRYPLRSIRHCIDGYKIMMENGYPFIARICITHSFQIKDIESYSGKHDISQEEAIFISKYLQEIDYSDYDLLIQLCDALVDGKGYCLIEKRLVDVAIRNGLSPLIIEKWKKIIELKTYFEKKIGCSIYSLLPGVVENTFEDEIHKKK